jgi:hypothetical protein
MPKLLPLVALALVVAMESAAAADLAGHSRLGAVFASPPVAARGVRRVEEVAVVAADPEVRNSPRVAGYYGDAGDFHYHNYYGTPRPLLGRYLPYACVLEMLC